MRSLFLFLFLFSFSASFSQTDLPVVTSEADWEKVILTKIPDDVKGLKRIGDVQGKGQKAFGNPAKLRLVAVEQIKREAAKKGASIVFLSFDEFNQHPLNNHTLQGTAYTVAGVATSEVVASGVSEPVALKIGTVPSAGSSLPVIASEADWEKVILTKIPDDVKGLVRVGDLQGKGQKAFGDPGKLRVVATEQIKREAAKKGAAVVFISFDEFSQQPLNNVTLQGTAYKAAQ